VSEDTANYVERGLILHWERAEPPRTINYAYQARALVALEEYFGAFPITITIDDLKAVRAMQTAGGGRPLDDIIRAVEREGSIRIWWAPLLRRERVASPRSEPTP
jgi:hypothetical protein